MAAETKDIMINKFRVKYGGFFYGPGQEKGNVIFGIPAGMADSLIDESRGTIVEITRPVTNNSIESTETADAADTADSDKSAQETKTAESGKVARGGRGGSALPSVNPKNTVGK